MKRRIPIFGILIILLGLSFTPLNQGITIRESYNPIYSRGILYVGGTGPGNYTKIQDAIDNAIDGDTVFVYRGIYYENVEVDKSLDLIGKNRRTTIIDGSKIGNVVNIYADWVNITGFTIQNSGEEYNENYRYDTGVYISSSFNDIFDNIIINNLIGIYPRYGKNNTIIENTISKNILGIYGRDTNDNLILYNKIRNNKVGIWLYESCNNDIINNKIIFTTSICGIYLTSNSNSNLISRNTIAFNIVGLQIFANSNSNRITENNFLFNPFTVVWENSNNNIWSRNYWNRPRFLPKPIIGWYVDEEGGIRVHWFNFDWHPAKLPYKIEV